jgi:hypothetical protein
MDVIDLPAVGVHVSLLSVVELHLPYALVPD